MRRKNTTAETLKEYIADALFRLMPTKSIDKITISEITDLANVGRATYFRYFSCLLYTSAPAASAYHNSQS